MVKKTSWLNWNNLKEKFTFIDNAFGWFQNTKIGKYYLKGTSFNKILLFFGSILVAQVSAYSNLISLAEKVDIHLANSDGWTYVGWFILSWFMPEGNLFLIFISTLILFVAFIIQYRIPKEKSIEDGLLKPLKEKTRNILFEIRTNISYKNEKIELDRSKIINHIKNELDTKQTLIISGAGGVGKTSIIKNLYVNKEDNYPFYVFKAREFKTNSLFFNYSLQDFIDSHKKFAKKIIVIDSAEALLDFENDYFKEFISALIQHNWKVVFTTRYSYLDDLNYHLTQILHILPFRIDIENLSHEELESLSNSYDFNLPQDDKLLDLIKNPFYLNEYLANYSNDEINYPEFKDQLWNRNINTPDMEKCFFDLAFKRANDGQFYVDIECSYNSLKLLQKKGILGYEKSLGYFVTHDIYEEWALERIVNKEFKTKIDIKSFFEKIGSSLPIRRAFRNWVSEKLLLDSDDVKPIIEEIIDDGQIELFWKDEVFVSILLSDYSDTFFENFEKELLANDCELLKRISFLLRLACKEVDNSLFEQYKLNIDRLTVFSMFNKPKGNGWKNFIRFVYKHIDTIVFPNINMIVPILLEWNSSKDRDSDTTELSTLIALQYYKNNHKTTKIIQTIIYGALKIKNEFIAILNEVLQKQDNDSNGLLE